MTDDRTSGIDRSQRRLGPIWLSPGVTPANTLTMFYSSMMTIVFITAIGILFPYLLHEHLRMPVEVQGNFTGNIVVIAEIIVIALTVPLGILSDRWGRRPLYTAGFVLVAVGLVFMPLARSNDSILACRILTAVGLGIGTTMLATTIADYPQNPSRGKFISVNGVITNLGVIVLSALVFAQLPKFFVGRGADAYVAGSYTFWTMAVISALTAGITFAGLQGGRAVAHASRDLRSLLRTGFAEVRDRPRLRLACVAYFVSRGDLTVFVMFFSLWLVAVGREAGIPTAEAQAAAGRLFGIAQLAMLLVTPVMGWLVDRLDRVVALAVSMAVAFVGYLALAIVPDPLNSPWMYLAAILGGAGEAAVVVSGPALVGQEAAPRVRGSIIGFVLLFGALGVLVNSKVAGVLFDDWMYQGPFVLMAGMNLLVFVAAIATRRWEVRRLPGATLPELQR
jgi:MFS family permease